MCKESGKPLYAGGVAMQILIFLIATNFITEFNIINSDSNIKTIEELSKIPQNFQKTIKKYDYFLDYVTGDLYSYNHVRYL